jgi:hypothetical protein
MKLNPKCYACVYCQQCDKEQEQKCRKLNYALFTTEEQKQMCELMCGGIEKDDIEMD